MRLPPNSWPTTSTAEDILFFAQHLREMLTPMTFESYRAMSLDTVARLKEASIVLQDVEQGRIKPIVADTFLDELAHSLKNDPVLPLISRGLDRATLEIITASKTPDRKKRAAIDALRKRVTPLYKDKISSEILKNLHTPKSRHVVRELAKAYCSHVANSGYSRAYLLASVEERFFSKPMLRVSDRTVSSFFRLFGGEDRNYVTYVQCSTKFQKALKRVGFSTFTTASLPTHLNPAFTAEGFQPTDTFIAMAVPAKDPYEAGNAAEAILGSIQSLNFLGPQADGYTWAARRFVCLKRAKSGTFLIPPAATPITHRRPFSAGGKNGLRSVVSITMGQFDSRSTPRLLASLNTSDIQERHSTIEGRFISLWSAIEVLIGDPPPLTARISHYSESIIPCICLRYMRRRISSTHDELQSVYRNKFNKIIRKEPDLAGEDFHTRFAAILMLDKNKALQKELTDLCYGNPWGRHRLHMLWSTCKNPDDYISSISSHEERIKWQVARIYRVRNTLVHAGQKPTHTDMLVKNLFEYYSTTVWTILQKARSEKGKSKLSDIIKEIDLDYKVYVSRVKEFKEGGFTPEGVKELMLFLR